MSAEALLRRAAEKLKLYAEQATPGPWDRAGYHEVAAGQYPDNAIGNWSGEYARCVSYSGTGDGPEADRDARYVALMHPPVALALAAWLELEAKREAHYIAEFGYRVVANEGHDLARAILREVS